MAKKKRKFSQFIRNRQLFSRAALTILMLLIVLPMIVTVLYSFFSPSEITAFMKTRNNYVQDEWMDIKLAPKMASLRQYYNLLIEDVSVLRLFVNSAMYAVAILIGQAIVIPAMAYGLSRFTFKGRDAIFFGVIMLMLLPFQVTMVPNVLTLRKLGLMDTVWAVIMPNWFAPFYIFLIRQFMVALPNDILEAAQIDGAGTFRCFIHAVLPVCKPIIGCAVALSFADCWNLVEQPITYLSADSKWMPLSVMFNNISKESSGVEFAGAVIYILPALFIYMYFQKDILDGVQLTELK